MPAANTSSATPVVSGSVPINIQRKSLIEVRSELGASAVPLQECWGLPEPNTVTNEGINSWMKQVIEAYTTGNPAVLADSCIYMYTNTQLLNAGTMDMMPASLLTYSNESSNLLATSTACNAELVKLKEEYTLYIRTCQE